MKNRNKIMASVIALVAALLLLSTALAQTSGGKEKLYGSWNVEVMTVNQPQADGSHKFPALLSFGAEGVVIADEPPGPGETSGHGNWITNDDGTVSFTFTALFSEEGAYSGKLKVVGKLQYNSEADTWQGPFKIDAYDADDKVVGGDTGTFDLARMAVESLD
jgi:hypothetical protein